MEKRGRNRAQRLSFATAAKRPNQAETVASSRHQSPPTSHGKEGVDGSSPSEGSVRALPPAGPVPVRINLRTSFSMGGMIAQVIARDEPESRRIAEAGNRTRESPVKRAV